MNFFRAVVHGGLLVVCVGCAGKPARQPAPIGPTPTSGSRPLDPTPPGSPPFSIVLIPDTQNYTGEQNGDAPPGANATNAYEVTTKWIVANRTQHNIVAALHLGDLTNSNGQDAPDFDRQWTIADRAQRKLDAAKLPNSVIAGNHDHFEQVKDKVFKRRVPEFEPGGKFAPSRYSGQSWYLNTQPFDNPSNAQSAITFAHGSWKFLAIGLDHAPTKNAVCWARDLIRKHPDHRVILTTHCYLHRDGTLDDPGKGYAKCAVTDDGKYNIVGLDPEDLWSELVSLHSNVVMIASGHVNGDRYRPRQSAASSRKVHEILLDHQDEPLTTNSGALVEGERQHGNGWIKLLKVDDATGGVTADSIRTTGAGPNFNKPEYYATNPDAHAYQFVMEPTLAEDVHLPASSFADQAVNIKASRDQRQGSVALASDGNFVVVWEDDHELPKGKYELFGRRFDPEGCGAHEDFRVNQNSTRQQLHPDVAVDAAGNAVMVWEDDSAGAANVFQIHARGIKQSGTDSFATMTVNTVASGDQRNPRVAVKPDGSFAVAWTDGRASGSKVFVRGFNANGSPSAFGEHRVHPGAAGAQGSPDIAFSSAGDIIVVWERGADAWFSVLKPDGSVRIPPRVVSENKQGWQGRPSVDALPNGGFVVAWEHCTGPFDEEVRSCSNRRHVRVRRFDAQGVGEAGLRASDRDVNGRAYPRVAANAAGHFVVVWQDDKNDNGWFEIKKTAFKPQRVGPITVNKNSRGQQERPDVSVRTLPNGASKWVIVWTDDLDKNGSTQVLAQGGTEL